MSLPRDIRRGEPIRLGSLTVFPLFTPRDDRVEYILSVEAVAAGTLTIEEVGEGGSVPVLLARNTGDSRVLLLEGEPLRGAKQNRVLNTSVLLPPRSETRIPVSCVEQGRWRYRSRQFSSDGTHSSPSLRAHLKRSVTRSVKADGSHLSDQGLVWSEVARQMRSLGATSETGAMSDTFDSLGDQLRETLAAVRPVDSATGLAVVLGASLVALDLFDKPETCVRVWDRLMTGFAIEALETAPSGGGPADGELERFLGRLDAAPWEPAKAVAEGEERRAEADGSTHALILEYRGTILHASAVGRPEASS